MTDRTYLFTEGGQRAKLRHIIGVSESRETAEETYFKDFGSSPDDFNRLTRVGDIPQDGTTLTDFDDNDFEQIGFYLSEIEEGRMRPAKSRIPPDLDIPTIDNLKRL